MERSTAIDQLRHVARSPASWSALTLCLAALAFGTSRDFGGSLLSVPVLSLLLLLALLCTGVALADPDQRRAALAAAILIFGAPLLYLGAAASRDHVAFAFWALAHPGTLFDRKRDGIVADWGGWGMAGSENDAYLVADPHDAIGTLPIAEAWRRRHRLGCEIVATSRMWPRLYIVTTYNCTFD